MYKQIFDALEAAAQWEWILQNKEKIETIALDNDETFVSFVGEDSEGIFKADIGNREGATLLLEALGFEVYDV